MFTTSVSHVLTSPVYSDHPQQRDYGHVGPLELRNTAENTSCHVSSMHQASNSGSLRRRGRRSSVPPEQREQTRRLKKQNMERRRRACISDKMNALHSLAMNILGIDAQAKQRVEKADILSTCYNVFEGLAKIAEEDPRIRRRFHQLRSTVLDNPDGGQSISGKQNKSHGPPDDEKENIPVSATPSLHSTPGDLNSACVKRPVVWQSTPVSYPLLQLKQENIDAFSDSGIDSCLSLHNSQISQSSLSSPLRLPSTSSLTFSSSDILIKPQPPQLVPIKHRPTAFSVPIKKRSPLSTRVSNSYCSTSALPSTSKRECVDTKSTVWRPYLD